MARLAQISIADYLLEKGYTAQFINELVVGGMRVNYGQNTTMGAFAGMVSLAGMESGLWQVVGGNNQVCERLLSRSGVGVMYNTTVTHIDKRSSPSGKTVYSLSLNVTGSSNIVKKDYDVVILAAPLEKADIQFTGFPVNPSANGVFERTVATFVSGSLNLSHFHYTNSPADFPSLVMTTETPNVTFNCIGQQATVDQKLPSMETYKVFSRKLMTEQEINTLFSDVKTVAVKDWLAYPHYNPPPDFLPFLLDDHLFYLNTIEWAASAMEMSCISAKNVALITAASLNRVNPFAAPPTAPTEHPERDEL